MTLIKTSILTAISTVIKMIAGFAINKVIAVYAGPSGLAFIGQLQNFISISTTLSNGAINNGIVKYTAQYNDINDKQNLFSTALKISFFSAILVALFIAIFSEYLSFKLFNNTQYINVLYTFSATIVFYSLNTLFLSILNGQKEIHKYVMANIANSLFALALISVLTYVYNLEGALYALVINQSLVFFVTLFFLLRSDWFSLKYFNQKFNIKEAKKLSHFSLMAIVSILSVMGSILIIRNYIGTHLSWTDAGYWQGIIYISDAYLLIITMTLSVYYLPRLSEITDPKELKNEILNGYKLILPVVSILALIIYVLKSYIIGILFTDNFLPMLFLFKWQLIGDVIKISSWLLAYLMLAKSMTKLYVYTEITFSILFITLSIIFINIYGLVGVTYAFAANYTFYLLFMIHWFYKNYSKIIFTEEIR